ncbi:hypothetical protein FHX44_115548 [Pseudonocardia hierapolitana]|uniref:Uncharacterized protein n=1 Tax=Pseudonocardia hierapolitana TaxID=1128676 RepID=A0A561SXM9_9PSEU|nr:hypothetical protein [Pseudonocardia hierapolitana]TWF79614.1 hypothetical protein FHX44_115548 [Pseudonocardia hierapolitana]
MDIIDVGGMGVRTAVVQLRRKGTPCRFTIYPMIHVGEPSFYRTVRTRLARHDLIVQEGISGPTRAGELLTSVYRSETLQLRLGLQVQPGDLCDVGVPVVRPDMTGPEFEERWRGIGLPERAFWYATVPAFGLYTRLFMSREMLARELFTLGGDTLAIEEPSGFALHEIVLDQRDALLCAEVTRIHTERCEEDIDVAVVYGAGHVAPLVAHLRARHGYVPRDAEWLLVFDF